MNLHINGSEVDILIEKLKEANSLADELAFKLNGIQSNSGIDADKIIKKIENYFSSTKKDSSN